MSPETAGRPTASMLSSARRVVLAYAVAALFAVLAMPKVSVAGSEARVWLLIEPTGLEAHGVSVEASTVGDRRALRVRLENDLDGGDADTYATRLDSDFQDGTIEVDVSSRVDPEAWFFVRWLARGFAGLTFRNDDRGHFEAIYIRPMNGRVDDETRRAHAVQYISYPDWDFRRFRAEAPGQYEGPADIGPDEWIHMRIEVEGSVARLFLDDNETPALVVDDLKLGSDRHGKVGLWVGPGTIAHFSNLKITPKP